MNDNPIAVGFRCPCGGVYAAAQRFERQATVDVVICWSCGMESPPLYQRPVACANGHERIRSAALNNHGPHRCQGCLTRARRRWAS